MNIRPSWSIIITEQRPHFHNKEKLTAEKWKHVNKDVKRAFKERMWRDTNGPCFGDCSMTKGCIVPHYALSTMCSLMVMIYSFKELEWWSGEVYRFLKSFITVK